MGNQSKAKRRRKATAKPSPRQIHVGAYGNDETGDGSLSRPYATVAHALEQAALQQPADKCPITIHVASGSLLHKES